ncbi:matrixin family metalloprotease [Aerosakkonema sp. BLCC-F183]|uniref:matrixin family metalloprotease n=1 Tax=Aerosakkonema sp. BLCC-F183 TaxID=3342834 RepID=UPI0035B8C198
MTLPLNTYFDENFYRLNNLDVFGAILKGQITSGYDHFVQFGARENRAPSQVFNGNYYFSLYPDVAAAVNNNTFRSGYDHFLQFGAREGRDPIPEFNSGYYLSRYPDIAPAINNGTLRSAYDHFLQYGTREGRDPSTRFNTSLYLSQNPDVAAAVSRGETSAFEHYILYGKNENRPGVLTNSFNIQFDYSFDTNGFFNNPERRTLLEAAADVWESYIQDEFKNVLTGTKFSLANPQNGGFEEVTLTSDIDDLRIYVGAAPTPFGDATDALAASSVEGYDADGSIYNARLNGSKFQPFAGNLSFSSATNWFFDPTPNTSNDIPNGTTDFFSVALHEIGHILGIGPSKIFQQLGAGASFKGPNAVAANGGQPVPLEEDLGHVKNGVLSDGQPVLMDPTYPDTRITPTRLDLALLADIGYRITNFQPQGSLSPISTSNDDTIFGTVLSDVINGNAGKDYLLGDAGVDLLRGGADDDIVSGEDGDDILFGDRGNDQVSGSLGDDLLIGGPGNDDLFGGAGRDRFIFEAGQDRIGDFVAADDIVQVARSLGFTSGANVFGAITSSGSTDDGGRFSIVTLSAENTITIFHNGALTAANFTVV